MSKNNKQEKHYRDKSIYLMMGDSMNVILFLVAILSFSQAATLSRLSMAPPELICFWRLFVASLIMGTVSLSKGTRLLEIKKLPRTSLMFTFCSGIFFWLHLWSFQFAAQKTPIANLMIIFATNPLFTGIISFLFLKMKLQKRLIPAYVLAISGIYFLVNQNIRLDPQNALGNWTALAAAMLFSLYVICGHEARKHIPNSTYTFLIYAIAAICFSFTTAIKGVSFFNYSQVTWLSILGLILFPTLLGHALFTYLLRYLNVNWMSTGKLAEPLFASVSAYFVFQESWNLTTAVAFSCTALSLLILLEPWKNLFSRNKRLGV